MLHGRLCPQFQVQPLLWCKPSLSPLLALCGKATPHQYQPCSTHHHAIVPLSVCQSLTGCRTGACTLLVSPRIPMVAAATAKRCCQMAPSWARRLLYTARTPQPRLRGSARVQSGSRDDRRWKGLTAACSRGKGGNPLGSCHAMYYCPHAFIIVHYTLQ